MVLVRGSNYFISGLGTKLILLDDLVWKDSYNHLFIMIPKTNIASLAAAIATAFKLKTADVKKVIESYNSDMAEKKNSDAPKKTNGYRLFQKEKRSEVVKKHPGWKMTELASVFSEMWAEADKDAWNTKAATLNEKNGFVTAPKEKSDEPKKTNGFQLFKKENRDEVVKKHPGLKMTELAPIYSEMWAEADKDDWNAKAAEMNEKNGFAPKKTTTNPAKAGKKTATKPTKAGKKTATKPAKKASKDEPNTDSDTAEEDADDE